MRRLALAARTVAALVSVCAYGSWMSPTMAGATDANYARNLARLVTAAWRDPSPELDVTLYCETARRPKARGSIEDVVRRMYDASDTGSTQDKAAREAEIASEVQRIEQEQNMPRVNRLRLRTKSGSTRMETVDIVSGDAGSAAPTWTNTYVNVAAALGYDYTHFEYNHTIRTATVFGDRQVWGRPPIEQFPLMPDSARYRLRILLGMPAEMPGGKRILVPCPATIDALNLNNSSTVQVEFSPVALAGVMRTAVRVSVPSAGRDPIMRLVCDSEDYSRVYEYQSFSPRLGQVVEERHCSDFDATGFPRTVRLVSYDADDGSFRRRESHAVETVRYDGEMADDIFMWNPPPGYGIVDRRFDKPITLVPGTAAPVVQAGPLRGPVTPVLARPPTLPPVKMASGEEVGRAAEGSKVWGNLGWLGGAIVLMVTCGVIAWVRWRSWGHYDAD